MPKLIDLTNKIFGKLIVIKRDTTNTKEGKPKWLCQCECGNIISVAGKDLRNGHTKSCGCLQKEFVRNINYKDLTGQNFGFLTVIKESPNRSPQGKILWTCKCNNCGKEKDILTNSLTSGKTVSCGCIITSIGELNIETILQNNQIPYEKEKVFFKFKDSNKNARYDFYLPEQNRIIEFDGLQHYQSNGGWNTSDKILEIQKRDKEKNEWAAANNIPLVRIPYWERDNITLDMIMGNKYLI